MTSHLRAEISIRSIYFNLELNLTLSNRTLAVICSTRWRTEQSPRRPPLVHCPLSSGRFHWEAGRAAKLEAGHSS